MFDIDGLTVYFMNGSQWASGYYWDFGDGTTSTDPNPYHVYAQDGLYVVTLTVETSNGCTSVNEILIEVGNDKVEAEGLSLTREKVEEDDRIHTTADCYDEPVSFRDQPPAAAEFVESRWQCV